MPLATWFDWCVAVSLSALGYVFLNSSIVTRLADTAVLLKSEGKILLPCIVMLTKSWDIKKTVHELMYMRPLLWLDGIEIVRFFLFFVCLGFCFCFFTFFLFLINT